MPRALTYALVQAPRSPIGEPMANFATDVERVSSGLPRGALVAYPELHLCGASGPGAHERLRACAEPLDGPRVRALAELAGDLGVWLLPGTVCETSGGEPFNTALAFSPEGELAASYRKIFPWRPYEPYRRGGEFVVFDAPDLGRVGFSICFDAWFPETARHLAWMGAEVIVNPVQTTTPDRPQEVVLNRANAIANQVFVLSVNEAGPEGRGHSLAVDPEGRVLAEAPGPDPAVLTGEVDLDEVARVRSRGTAGVARVWDHFDDTDDPVRLPLYQGRIDPGRWKPAP
ncbi:carbon-nitrogen hydrolase family protein [Saccharopolyspora griseoalba]|uniref:Carbon-nitrogen hydrolase family protein n=1 Tax=Saccharopolyspora griseoalba TaxID=1431848 RepID=A0ABW2LSX1_9PSEU